MLRRDSSAEYWQKDKEDKQKLYRKLSRRLLLTDVLLAVGFIVLLLVLQCKLTRLGKWFTPPYCSAGSKVVGYNLSYLLGSIPVSASPVELTENVGVYVVETKENNTVKIVPVNTLSEEFLKNVTLVKDGNILKLQSGDKTISEISLSEISSPQELELVGNVLTITDGNSVTFLNWDTNVSDDVRQITDLSDVLIGAPNVGDILTYNGSSWTNKQLKFIDLGDTPSDYGTAGFILQTDGTGSISYVDPATLNVGYWQRIGTSLSPKNAGDDVVLNPGEELFLKGLTTNGGVLFTDSSGQVGQSSRLYWDVADDRLNIDGGLNARKTVTVDSTNYRSYDYNYIRRDFIVDNNFSNLYLNGLSVRAYGNATAGTTSTGMIIGLESLVGATDALSPHEGYIDWLVALAGVVKNFGPSHTGTYDKVMALAGILDASPGSSGTINRGYGLFLNYEVGSSPGAIYNDIFGVYVQSPFMVNYFAGNTGIGTDTPATKLHVIGDIYAEGGQIRLGNFAGAPSALGAGSMYYDTSSNMPFYYDGSAWQPLAGVGGDKDWFQAGSTQPPTGISQDIFTDGKVGIGISSPLADLHIAGDGMLIAQGEAGVGADLPTLPADMEAMIWYPKKGAFRAGGVFGSGYWAEANIGFYSVAFGFNNSASGTYSGVGGGGYNEASRDYAVVAGGHSNISNGDYSAIVGGDFNSAIGTYSFMGGGLRNVAGGYASAVVGGTYNQANGWANIIGGGGFNVTEGNYSTIAGGNNNRITAWEGGAIGGGVNNEVSGRWGVVAGGRDNVVSADSGVVAGGFGNQVGGWNSVVSGGVGNRVEGGMSVILGGSANYVRSDYSLAAGGGMFLDSLARHTFVWGYDPVCISGSGCTAINSPNSFLIGPVGTSIKVGVGTPNPVSKLHVVADNADQTADIAPRIQAQGLTGANDNMVNLTLYTNNAGLNYSSGLAFAMQNNSFNFTEYARIRSVILDETSGFEGGALDFLVKSSGILAEAMRIDNQAYVGIGTSNPAARLHVANDGMILAEGTFNSGISLPVSGAGTRLVWYPRKAAFRVGTVSGTQWDDFNVGEYSAVVGGVDNVARQLGTGIIGGTNNVVSGALSTIVGGAYNTVGGETALIGGGQGNIIETSSLRSGIIGGDSNVIASPGTSDSVILGGALNTIDNGSRSVAVISGDSNIISGSSYALLSGDNNQLVSGNYMFGMGTGMFFENVRSIWAVGENIQAYNYAFGTSDYVYILGSNITVEDASNVFVFDVADPALPAHIFDSNVFLIGPSDTLPILVGVGVLSPAYRLELPNIAGPLGQGRANAWVTYSDARIKSNQQELEYGLATIMQLNPKKYVHHSTEFKDGKLVIKDEGKETIGFIAQEVYKVIPEIVYKPKDESKDLWSMDYEKLIPVLVKAIQELNSKVENLNAKKSSADAIDSSYWTFNNEILSTDHTVSMAKLMAQEVTVTSLNASSIEFTTLRMAGDNLSIDAQGNLITKGNLTVKGDVVVSGTLKVKDIEVENGFIAQAQGQITVDAGKQEVFVSVNNLSQNYNVFITQYGQNIVSYSVVRKTDGFTLKFSKPLAEDTEFGWIIFQVK